MPREQRLEAALKSAIYYLEEIRAGNSFSEHLLWHRIQEMRAALGRKGESGERLGVAPSPGQSQRLA